jgi:hypothetical protein
MVLLEIWEDERALAHIYLDAPSVDEAIRNLGTLREKLPDPIPEDLDPNARMEAVVSPVWKIPYPDQYEGHRTLALRHNRYGWLGFLLPEREAQAIADWLTRPFRSPK